MISSSRLTAAASAEKPVIIHNNIITCPHCNNAVHVKRKGGGGASYVADWKKLNPECQKILTVWMSHDDLRNSAFEKTELRHKLTSWGLMLNEGPFNARISELLGLGLISTTMQVKSGPHKTKTPPKYYLNHLKVYNVLNNGGLLH